MIHIFWLGNWAVLDNEAETLKETTEWEDQAIVADSLDLGDEYVVYLLNSSHILIPRCKACLKSHATVELNSNPVVPGYRAAWN